MAASTPAHLLKLAALLVGGFAVALAVLIGPQWFMAIPWRYRWWMGESIFLGLLAGTAALAYRLSPPRAWAILDPAASRARLGHRLVAIALPFLSATFAYPLFDRPGNTGVCDWDLHLAYYEALRKTILEYGQFPWWNPWCCGGFPLGFEPQVGLISFDTPLVLLLGTSAGLRWAAVADILLAVEGMRRLARLWFDDPWAVALAAAVYGWNGAIVIFTVSGRALTMCYPFLPWMLLYAFQIGRGRRPAILLGVWTAFSVWTVIQYPTAYAGIITGIVLAWGFLAQAGRMMRARYLGHVTLAAGVFFLLAGARLGLSGAVLADFPRKLASMVDWTPWALFHACYDRAIPPARVFGWTPGWNSEIASYIGWAPLLAACVSLRRGWRWWHAAALGSFAMATGSIYLYHPSYWVSTWPVFSTMHMVGRWRICGLFALAMAAASEIQAWRGGRTPSRVAAAALVLGVVADLAVYAHQCLPTAYSMIPADTHVPDEPPGPGRIANIERWEFVATTQNHEAVRRGFGVVRGYCPQLGYNRDERPTTRLWRGHPAYLGEAWSDGRPVEPALWTPNRIVFRVRPGQEVHLNQNPGSWWWANGRQLFPGWKCAELTRDFVVRADDSGRIDLQIRPRGIGAAAGLTILGALVTTSCLGVLPRVTPGSDA